MANLVSVERASLALGTAQVLDAVSLGVGGGDRIGVVGAGIIGLAVARRVAELRPGADVTVFEKEDEVARHQSGRNRSG